MRVSHNSLTQYMKEYVILKNNKEGMGKLNKSKTKSKSKRKTGDEIPHISLRTAIQLIKGEYKFIYL